MSTRQKILFVGAFGINSFGDDASFWVFKDKIKKYIGDFDAVLIDRHAHENNYKDLGVRSIQSIEYQTKEESLGKWFHGFNYHDDRKDLNILRKEMASADLLVIGAGNGLNDISIELLRGIMPFLLIHILIANMYNVPVMLYGFSAGPIDSEYGRALANLIVKQVDCVTLRDELVKDFLSEITSQKQYHVFPDPVLGLKGSLSEIDSILDKENISFNTDNILAISVRNIMYQGEDKYEEYLNKMARLLDQLIDMFSFEILFIPQQEYEHGYVYEDDRYVAKDVIKRMSHNNGVHSINNKYNCTQICALYKLAKITIATRLHANVFSIINGVPIVALNYNNKVKGFMQYMGLLDYCFELDYSYEDIINRVKETLNNLSKEKQYIQNKFSSIVPKIDSYYEFANALINKKPIT